MGVSATFEKAPGYTELGQVIDKNINRKKGTDIDKPFLRLFENLDKSYFANQIPYMNNLKDPVIKHNDNKDFYSEQKNIVNIKNAMEKLSRDQITKELEGTLEFTEKDQQETIEDYIPFDIRQQLLEEGFSKEDAGL